MGLPFLLNKYSYFQTGSLKNAVRNIFLFF